MTPSYKLFLDDYRSPTDCLSYMHRRIGAQNLIYKEDWVIVRNYKQFVSWILHHGLPSLISYDHDLAEGHYHRNMQEGVIIYDGGTFENDNNKTGYHAAKWLVDYCQRYNYKLPDWIVHSMNPVGSDNIEGLLKNYRKHEKNKEENS